MRKGLTGGALKWIALITMLIDHFTAVFDAGSTLAYRPLFDYESYIFLRGVGRIAFPLYCFLLVEGYCHTRSVKKYLLRLGLFGIVSEVPFDLAFRRSYVNWNYQNVYFTLFLGLLGICLWDLCTKKDPKSCPFWRIALGLGAIAACALAAQYGRTDYHAWGVLVIAAMYLFRTSEWQRDLFSGCALLLASPLEACGFIDYILLHYYNGERGRQPKYLFYLFYPLHLIALVLLCKIIYGHYGAL